MKKNLEEFYEFYKEHAKKIFIFFYYLLNLKDEAHELTEQTFMCAYKNFYRKKKVIKDFNWLKLIAFYIAAVNGYEEKIDIAVMNLNIEADNDLKNDDKPEK